MNAPGADPGLVLRDIHVPPPPSWWPPAPGWWVVAAIVVLVAGLGAAWAWHRRQRRVAAQRLFDDTVATAGTPARQVAAMSALLRRAARQRDPAAATLQGADWLRYLDEGSRDALFGDGHGVLLLEGGFRREVAAIEAAALHARARQRFLEWMRAS